MFDDAVLECRTFSVALDDDEDVQIRVRARVAARLGAEERELQQLRAIWSSAWMSVAGGLNVSEM